MKEDVDRVSVHRAASQLMGEQRTGEPQDDDPNDRANGVAFDGGLFGSGRVVCSASASTSGRDELAVGIES
jgi:hypothetical protein